MTKKSQTADLALTQKDLNDEGIKTQLTQNDLLEVIVSEKHKEFTDEYDLLEKRALEIETKLNEFHKNQVREAIEKMFKKLKITVNLDNSYHNVYDSKVSFTGKSTDPSIKNENGVYIHRPTTYREKQKTIIGESRQWSINTVSAGPGVTINKSFTADVSITEKKTDTLDITTKYSIKGLNVVVNTPAYKKLLDELNAHNKHCSEFIKRYQGVDLRYESILKEIRVAFNKKLIVDSAPNLRKRISGAFNIELK